MPVGLLGRKVGMTQVYDEDANLIPVTVIEAGPCTVLQVRTEDRDGYSAVQLGFDDKPRRKASRSERGHVAAISSKRSKQRGGTAEPPPKAGSEPKRFIREFRTDGEEHGCEVGQQLNLETLAEVKRVDIVGTTKGRGTAGVMKRHNFGGQRATHGVKRVHRHPGSIGMSADPSRVLKGTAMAGRYGNERVSARNLAVVQTDVENNMLVVKGAIPGPNGGYVMICETNKR